MQSGAATYKEGDYPRAVRQLEAAVAEAESFGEHDRRLATSLNELALLDYTLGRYDRAEALFKRSLSILEQVIGPEHTEVAHILSKLGGLYQAQGRTVEAEVVAKRALSISEAAHGPNDPRIAIAINNLAGLYQGQGRTGTATLSDSTSGRWRFFERVLKKKTRLSPLLSIIWLSFTNRNSALRKPKR